MKNLFRGSWVSYISKVESAYLQLLRGMFLVIATITIVFAVILGVKAFFDHNAEPKAVPDQITISPQSFKISNESSGSDAERQPITSNHAPSQDPENVWRADVVARLLSLQKTHPDFLGQEVFGEIEANNIIDDILVDTRSKSCAEAYIPYLDQVLSRPDVKESQAKEGGRTWILGSATAAFTDACNAEQRRIEHDRSASVDDAIERHSAALKSLPIIGILTSAFIVLVLLLVLLRVDRSIREIATTHDRTHS